MKLGAGWVWALALALPMAAGAQQGGGWGGRGGGQGQAAGQGGGQGMMMLMNSRSVMGTVTEVAADHFRIKTYLGDSYLIHYSVNTHFVKAPEGGRGMGRGEGGGRGDGMGRRAEGQQQGMGAGGGQGLGMTEIKAADIKIGSDIAAMGEIDPVKKEAGAVNIVLVDPERAQAMKQQLADYGKTWVMGKVTAIDGVKVMVEGAIDQKPHTIVADENTTLRKRRDPITLADIQVGDTVRADGKPKGDGFAAATIQVMGQQPGGPGRVPRDQPQAPPQQ